MIHKDIANKNSITDLLQGMVDKDQKALNKKPVDKEEVKQIMIANRKTVRSIVKEYGLISFSKFGEKASFNAWLLIQHFPKTSIRFMEKYLDMMEKAKGDVNLKNLAYLQDRVNVYKGNPQVYGTQLYAKKGSEICEFRTMKNISKVDELRKGVGLEKLSEYVKSFEEISGNKAILPEGYKE